MNITITDSALAKLRELLAEHPENARVRLNVHSQSCLDG